MPSDVDDHVGLFDQIASTASKAVSRAPFFIACLAMVVVWAPSYFVIHDLDLWQLIINTATTIITFLLVALLQNSQYRADAAIQHKLNAIACGLEDVLAEFRGTESDRQELNRAVGLEDLESSTD